MDPGSQLLYIVDTGVNLRTAGFSDSELESDANALLGITDSDLKNFIAITNAHPTKAVTIHFRYFNDVCEDVLDFLVILTCNDSLLFDPFDFEIPGASLGGSAVNTKRRIFGPELSENFPAIAGNQFNSGRFLIFATPDRYGESRRRGLRDWTKRHGLQRQYP